jgi:hypothetical protein
MPYNTLTRQSGGGAVSFSVQPANGSAIHGDSFIQALSLANKALLAGVAMENTAILSTMAEYLRQTAPAGSEHYRLLVNAYVAAATNMIRR